MADIDRFDVDPYPDRPRILFIGLSESSHTQTWIQLFNDGRFNVRLFALPTGAPPDAWPVRTYLTAPDLRVADSDVRLSLPSTRSPYFWLAEVIRTWQPQVIHTFSLDLAGQFYFQARQTFGLAGIGKWVLQLWGGSDIFQRIMLPEKATWIDQVVQSADQILVDNQPAADFVTRLGGGDKLWESNPVPGIGGVDLAALKSQSRPSIRRVIVWSKAYTSPWSSALPVLEALRLSWSQLQPCEVYFLAASVDVQMWLRTMPEDMRQHCHVNERIPREDVFALMRQARVLLAPSLVDGLPNSMLEAMASGALPIVSPLDGVLPVVQNGQNVLFARNLYPQEIADALVRAMTDDALVDRAAEANAELVRQIADRAIWRPRVQAFYAGLAAETDLPAASTEPILVGGERDDDRLPPLPDDTDPVALKLEYDHLYRERADLSRSLTDLHQQFADAGQRLDEMEGHYADLKAEYERSQVDLVSAQRRLDDYADLKAEYDRAQLDLVTAQQRLDDYSDLKTEYDRSQVDLVTAQQRLTEFQTEYGLLHEQQLDLQSHYQALQQEYDRSQRDLVSTQQNLADFQREYAAVESQLQALQAADSASDDSLPEAE